MQARAALSTNSVQLCNRHYCVYSAAYLFRMQGRMGDHERGSLCDWNSRAVDRAVCRRVGISCVSTSDPCTVGGISMACYERILGI